MRNRIAATALACLLPPAGGALGASPPIDPIFADAFDSCRGDPSCWLTIKPAQVDAVAWFDARCNDGTPASYELRPSPTGSHDWVILFEGGGSCDDSTLICADRGTRLTTTSPAPNGSWTLMQHGGILNPNPAENPDFYAANLVQFNYCSSDQWSGATAELRKTTANPHCASDDGSCGWQFSGRLAARAEIQSLIRDQGLADDGSQRVLFVGTSAGGFGLVANAEAMRDALPASYAADRLRFLVDGAFALSDWDVAGHSIGASTLTSVDAVAAQNRVFWRSNYETWCERDRAANGLDPSLCTFGPIYYAYLTSATNGLGLKLLVQNSTLDLVATTRLDLLDVNDPAREQWRCAMTAALTVAPWLFSSGDVYHTLSPNNSSFDNGPPGGPTFRDVVGNFWNDRPSQRVVYDNPACP